MPLYIERGFCWPGIDRTTWPPGYRLGLFTIRFLTDGLDEHVRKLVEKARIADAKVHNERLERIKREMEGGK